MGRSGRPWKKCLLAFLLAAPAGGQSVDCGSTGGVFVGILQTAGSVSLAANCSGTHRCYPPVLKGASYEVMPAGCNPKAQTCSVRATVPVEFPGHAESPDNFGGGAHLE